MTETPQQKQFSDEQNLKSLRILSAIGIIVGSWSLIFEIYFFHRFLLEIYFARLTFTLIALGVFILSYRHISKRTSNVLIHIFIISLISSFVITIYQLPKTIYINSQILSLLIFTIAIIFSWEMKNQIIVAIYYNLLFAASIALNDQNIYLLPNLFSLIIFVSLISTLSVAVSFVNYNLRKKYAIRTEEIDFLFNSIPVGICRTEMNGKVITSNRYFLDLFGIDNHSKEYNILSLITDDQFKEYFDKVCRTEHNIEKHNAVVENRTGASLYLKISAKKILNDTFKRSIEFIFDDETREALLAKEKDDAAQQFLKETKEKERIAQEALLEKKRKLEMLAKINHEVRTPLNSILIYFEMIEDGFLISLDEIKKYSKSVKTASQSLLQTINNFVDYVKIETGKIEVENELFNIVEELESITLLLQPLAITKNNELLFVIDECSKNLVFTDAVKYRQVVINLVANSIKFTNNGVIKITMSVIYKADDDYEIITAVSDSGSGIPQEKLGSIFDPFVSLKEGDKTSYSSGLGLTICREFVSMLNGEIIVESGVGKGTKFTLKIPYTYKYPLQIQ